MVIRSARVKHRHSAAPRNGSRIMAEPTLSSPSPSTPEHPSVRPVACLRCRNRRSYCSKEKPTCSRCREGPFNCKYEEARKITVNETYLRKLEAKVKAYEATAPSEDNGDDDGDYEQLEDDHVLLGPFTQLSIDKPSTSFKGPGSSDYFVLKVREVSGVPGYDDDSLDLNPNFYDPGALPSRRRLAVRTRDIRLPPIDIARRLFAAYYTYIGTIFGFTDPAAFELDLAAAYRGQPDLGDTTACLRFAKVLTILAFGQLYSVNQWIDFKGPPGFEYFSHALLLLPDAHEEGSILCAETLALVGYFMQNMNRRDAAFLYIGMALRMAISLGLHQEVRVTSTTTESLLDREHRRRVWWSVYSLDRILTVKSGNPITIHDEDIGVHLPSALPHDPAYCPALVLRHYTELSRILGTITQAIYRRSSTPQSGRRLMAAVQAIVLALSRWRAALPDELRFDPARLSISRESVSTFSHYYQCINMTARPLLFHVVQQRLRDKVKDKPWKDGLSTTTVRVIDMCIRAAQDTVNMMTIARQRDLVATYGYMDGEHVFSAAIVLVMVCVAFPASEANTTAMNAGLELLRGMAERGNSHMAARYELLVRLRSAGPGLGPWLDPVLWTTGQAAMLGMQFGAVPAAVDGAALGSTVNMRTNMGAAAGSGSGTGLDGGLVGGTGLVFPMVDHRQLGEPFYDETMSNGGDFMLWEQGFANPAVDVGYDLTHLTNGGQAAK
ncbi:fungal-specific transcription factor [Podospora appendiculata]|uniref:Fungal-specific transcription factor n=1 Tax=Podospora appendiculata TaxID=314037 RepID=A0AAE0WYM6_9PEZI|nr:fungal-specific transcription factor [Podospora appendiculata]KAK3680924.1 fungal-specific transcription factor [Podospora appendiculata]